MITENMANVTENAEESKLAKEQMLKDRLKEIFNTAKDMTKGTWENITKPKDFFPEKELTVDEFDRRKHHQKIMEHLEKYPNDVVIRTMDGTLIPKMWLDEAKREAAEQGY